MMVVEPNVVLERVSLMHIWRLWYFVFAGLGLSFLTPHSNVNKLLPVIGS